ncbi:MAG TPA: hypothetical protein PLP19_18905 [bacterium]|nr:hypothetical protein [bacterium]HPN45567.1 hypothetical protein [bacterium]
MPKESQELKTSRFNVQYENGSLRYIKYGNTELVRMIYSAVRDHNWGTIEPVIRDETIEKQGDSIIIRYKVEYKKNDIVFSAEYTISIIGDIIRFTMHGQAGKSFKKNRIGFCVLHPIKECMGKECIITHPDGTETTGKFPKYISPHQPFKNIQSMRWQPEPGIEASILFHGEVFETEDQRNWIDASYKTYCTPLELPFPVRITKGQVIEQSVEIKIQGQMAGVAGTSHSFHVSNETIKIPRLGIGASSLKKTLDAESVARLKALKLHHYRIDIDPENTTWAVDAAREIANAAALNLQLEVALYIEPNQLTEFAACVQFLQSAAAQIYVFNIYDKTRKATNGELLTRVVPMLRSAFPTALIGAGTDFFFAELNRSRSPAALVDFLTFSINPQVHAFDHRSLTETLAAHQYVVSSARQFTNGKELHISPVTLKMRSNPNVTGPEPAPEPGELPCTVDSRQMSLYGAAWTLGSIKYLAEAGADAITYFETVGWRGLLQGDQDSELPEKFAAVKGQVFPVWQIFKWILEFQAGVIIPITSSQPLWVDGLMLQKDAKRRLIMANYSLKSQTWSLPEKTDHIVVLDKQSVTDFSHHPEALKVMDIHQEQITLLPYSVACIDFI